MAKNIFSSTRKTHLLAVLLLTLTFVFPSCAGNNAKTAERAAAEQTQSADTLRFLFAGDAMQHTPQLNAALRAGGGKTHDYSDCFTFIAPEIKAADYAVANLEVPLGGGPKYRGYPNFSSPDSYAAALRDAGFDMLLTANNHCLDSGTKAARRTLWALDSLGIDHVGTYRDSLQRTQLVPFIKDINGVKVGFLNYTYGTNGIPATDGMEVSLIDRKKIAEEMRKTRAAGAELLVVMLHWGIEYVQLENENQRQLADFLVKNGADMIIGSHPHVIEPMKVVRNEAEKKNVLIVYSLGNFLSNQNDTNSRGGALVYVQAVRGADGKMHFDSAQYDTFFTAKPEGSQVNYRVVPSWMPDKVPAGQKRTFDAFTKNAWKVFDANNVNVPRRHE